MALFKCSNCGYEKDTRCKPKSCPECGTKESFIKLETAKKE